MAKTKIFLLDRQIERLKDTNFLISKVRYRLKMAAFWDIVPYSLVAVDRCFRGEYCLSHPDDGGSTHIRNFSLLQRHYTAQYPRRVSSSHSPPREPYISHRYRLSKNYITTYFFQMASRRKKYKHSKYSSWEDNARITVDF
jgi:hypothetical protein